MAPRTRAILGLAVVAAVAVALTWWRAQQPVEVLLAHPDVPAERWTAYLAAVEARPEPTGAAAEAVLAAFVAVNEAERAARQARRPSSGEPAVTAALQAFADAQGRFDALRGATELVHLGRWQGLRLIRHLEDLLAAARRAGQDPIAWIAAAPEDPIAQAAIRVAGGLLEHLEPAGFVADRALVERRLPLLQAVFMHQWLGPLRRTRPLDAHLRPDEVEWLLRWRLEWHTDGPLAERLAAADALATLPDYPGHLNAGVLLYRAGRFREALKRFETSTARRAPAYRRAARARLADAPDP